MLVLSCLLICFNPRDDIEIELLKSGVMTEDGKFCDMFEPVSHYLPEAHNYRTVFKILRQLKD